jgi:predicted nucleic acid-binding protein
MTVVSDTSSICYLVLIEAIEILPNLFDKVFIPQAVYEELTAEGSPE